MDDYSFRSHTGVIAMMSDVTSTEDKTVIGEESLPPTSLFTSTIHALVLLVSTTYLYWDYRTVTVIPT